MGFRALESSALCAPELACHAARQLRCACRLGRRWPNPRAPHVHVASWGVHAHSRTPRFPPIARTTWRCAGPISARHVAALMSWHRQCAPRAPCARARWPNRQPPRSLISGRHMAARFCSTSGAPPWLRQSNREASHGAPFWASNWALALSNVPGPTLFGLPLYSGCPKIVRTVVFQRNFAPDQIFTPVFRTDKPNKNFSVNQTPISTTR